MSKSKKVNMELVEDTDFKGKYLKQKVMTADMQIKSLENLSMAIQVQHQMAVQSKQIAEADLKTHQETKKSEK